MKNSFLLIVFFPILLFSQIYDKYPQGQDDYEGGNVQFYKDFQKVLIDNKIKNCENKSEFYSIKFVVYPDRTVKFVKDDDTLNLAKNKCAFDLSRNVAKYLENWKPAVVDGKPVAAITGFIIIPNDLFENYKEGYDPMKYSPSFKNPEFEGGINEFRKKVSNYIDLTRFRSEENFSLEVLFDIDETGEMKNVRLAEETPNKEFNRQIISNILSIKKKWKPATVVGVPVKYQFRLPLRFNFQ